MKANHNEKETAILDLYENIQLGNSEICWQCRSQTADLSKPVGVWLVGDAYGSDVKRILFVGKNARGDFDNQDHVMEFGHHAIKENKRYAYWYYTKLICKEVYGENGEQYIAFTNIVKCNASLGSDKTTKKTKDCCIRKLQVLKQEIEVLKPNIIIFYTSWDYDNYLDDIIGCLSIKEKRKTTKMIGNYELPWMDVETSLNGELIHILRTGHPERKNKKEFVSAVQDWIKSICV